MREIALFGVRYFDDGTRDEKMISCAKSLGTAEQEMEMCAHLPVKEFDGFLFIDGSGRFYRYGLGKPPRQRRKINCRRILEELISKG